MVVSVAKYSYHRIDANHREIVDALKAVGASVNEKGPLDVLCGFRGRNYLLEIKTTRGKLRASQKAFLASWSGQAVVVRSVDEALTAIGVTR